MRSRAPNVALPKNLQGDNWWKLTGKRSSEAAKVLYQNPQKSAETCHAGSRRSASLPVGKLVHRPFHQPADAENINKHSSAVAYRVNMRSFRICPMNR